MIDLASNNFLPAAALSARTLILDLLDTGEPPDFSTRDLVHAGAAFGIEPTGIRTALTRLRQEGRVRVLDRGRYTIGARAEPLQQRILGWRRVEARRRAWDGGWLLAIAGPQDRVDRTRWRHSLRALALEGFVEAETNVWARPDNLSGGALAMRERLTALDAAPDLLVVAARDLDAARAARFAGLWPVADLVAGHGRRLAALEASSRRLPGLPLAEAAAECLLVGREALRAITRDPLLPEALCPPGPLSALIAGMSVYDREGKAIWRAYLAL